MIREQHTPDPADLVVWLATALLAALIGFGLGFVLWSTLTAAGSVRPWGIAAYAAAFCLLVFAFRAERTHLRTALVLCALSLALSFLLGARFFAPLFGG
jgi:Kef-type K+ transport system membrane component KefB